jgi:hypothetical protein
VEEITLINGQNVSLKTWDDIKVLDDVILEGERDVIKYAENKSKIRCPCLQKEGNFFYYCSPKKIDDKEISPANKIYNKKVSPIELQLHCMATYQECCFYNGKLRR